MYLEVTVHGNESVFKVYFDKENQDIHEVALKSDYEDTSLGIDTDNLYILDKNFNPVKLIEAIRLAAIAQYETDGDPDEAILSDQDIMRQQHSLSREQMGIK